MQTCVWEIIAWMGEMQKSVSNIVFKIYSNPKEKYKKNSEKNFVGPKWATTWWVKLMLVILCFMFSMVSALYVVVLLASACCCSLLKPASHAPALFHHNTNLQQLLDLRSNLSAQGISCHMCSGEKQHWHRYISHFPPISFLLPQRSFHILSSQTS